MVGRAVLVCAPPHGGACCVGLWSPSWWGVLCWCVPPSWWGVLCRCVPPPPWFGVLRWFVAPLVVGRAALVRGPPLGRACRVGACPPRSWCVVWGVVICSVGCGRGCVVGLARVGVVLVCAPSPVGACRVCAWPPPGWGVLCRRVRVSVRGVVAGCMPGWFCWFAVVSAAVQPALSGVGCLWCQPGRGWCSASACSPPCWGVPCLCVPPPLVGRAVLVRGPPLAGTCCVGGRLLRWWCSVWVVVGLWLWLCCWLGWGWCCAGACPPPCWGVSCLCVAPPWWGVLRRRFGVSVRGVVDGWMPGWFCWFAVVSAAARPALSGVGYLCCLPGRGWWCAGACPPPWWGVLRWVVAPLMVGRAVLVHAPPLAGVCCVGARLPRWWCLVWVIVACWVGCGCGCVVGLAGVGAVLVRAPRPLLGRAVFMRGPPLGGACCVGVFGFRFVVL